MSVEHFITDAPDGAFRLNLLVDGLHCPSCVSVIESALKKNPAVTGARLNLSTKRLSIIWKGEKSLGERLISLINNMGYRAVPFDPATSETAAKHEEKFLLRCLAVAGFASGNLMLFSIPLWTSGMAEMGLATRSLFQWIQVLIAIPAIAYSGMPFYRSAFAALKERRANMDVPISVAVILATLMSLFETITHGRHAYLDSAVMLLFFLLIGRYLEARVRGKARLAAHDLLQMMTGFATILEPDGARKIIPLSEIREGMTLLVASGEKIGADGDITRGESEIDSSLITGETMPQAVKPGDRVFAGTVNMSAPLVISVIKAGERSLIAEIVRLMETAEQSQARYVTVADKISSWYTPAVHLLALATFIGWLWLKTPWQEALLTASTVLIITCPCALGLAVPVVQVLASGRLMRSGVLIKSGSALERLAAVTHAVFDKTGTLTLGKPDLVNAESYPPDVLRLAASIAAHSRHPLSLALARSYKGPVLPLEVKETPGQGLEAGETRLGKASWCGVSGEISGASPELWLAQKYAPPVRFIFSDNLRTDAAEIIRTLKESGISTLLLSGDRPDAVLAAQAQTGLEKAEAGLSPVEKCERLTALKNSGAKTLMVGDGLNDAPSLAYAYVSISPSSAMDITQNAADIVFQGEKLRPVLFAWRMAKFSQILVKENFALAILYNAVAVPLAVAGYVTPLIAAIAMSSSSLLVIMNAMRLNLMKEEP